MGVARRREGWRGQEERVGEWVWPGGERGWRMGVARRREGLENEYGQEEENGCTVRRRMGMARRRERGVVNKRV